MSQITLYLSDTASIQIQFS